MHPILFRVAGETIYTYGAMLALGLAAAAGLFRLLAKREGLPPGDLLTYWAVYSAGVVGSRLLYIVTNLDEFESLASMTTMRRGGLVGYGGFLGGALVATLILRHNKVRVLAVADLTIPCLAALTTLTRLGCYGFGCDFGVTLSEGAPAWLKTLGTFPHWPTGTLDHGEGAPAWVFHVKERGLAFSSPVSLPVHPTQLYEVLLGLLVLGAWFVARERQRFRGQLFFQFVLAYGACRFALDPLRDGLDGGQVGPALAEHVLVPAGLAVLGLAFAVRVAPAVEDLTARRLAQGAAFAPALIAFALLRPGSIADTRAAALSTTQLMALLTGLAASYGFAREHRAALADPAGAMAIALPPADAEDAPRPVRKKKRRKKEG